MNIAVFCSANNLPDKYILPAIKLVEGIAKNGHTLVWGGSNVGLMGVIANTAQECGTNVIGVTTEILKEQRLKTADEMIITKDLSERKAVMLARSEVIVVLIGGIGTLAETFDILEQKRHEIHKKPVLVLNTANFYDGFQAQLELMQTEGFLKVTEQTQPDNALSKSHDELIMFFDEPLDVVKYIVSLE